MESFDAYAADSDGYTGFDSFRMAEDDERVYSEDHHFTAAAADEPKELGEEDEVESYSHGYEHHVEVPPPYQSTFDDDDGLSSAMSFDANRPRDFAPSEDFSPSMVSNGKGFGHPLEVEDVVYGFPPSSAGSVNGGAGLAPPEELDGMYGYPPQSGSFNGSAVLPPSEELDGMYGFPPQSGSFNGSAVLPPPEEMQAEEGFLLREWRRVNAIHLEEKSRTEREKLSQIIDAADVFKYEFYEKRRTHCETTQKNNREKEKVFLESNEKFHATADSHYWKAIGELIPNEMPSKEVKSRGNKDKKKPNVVINQGPKPGKPTDLSRMRQVLLKLKHNAPAHMKAPPVSAVPIPAGMEGPDAMAAASAAPQIQASIQAVAGA